VELLLTHYARPHTKFLTVPEAGLPPKLRLHDLRHSFASHAVMSGETLFSTSKLLGHSRIQMTARYAHLSDTSLAAAAEKVGRLILAQNNHKIRAQKVDAGRAGIHRSL
jgi:integrase